MGPGVNAPLIGISTSELRETTSHTVTEHGEPAQCEMALGMFYARAIARAGGIPVVMAPLDEEAVPCLLSRLAGICLSGGPDLDPSGYAEEPHRLIGPTHPELDRFEMALVREADRIDMPVLGICRGAQALNVARGGTLVQHLPELDGAIEHRQGQPGEQVTHDVLVARDSRLAVSLGGTHIQVNSFHHQAVRRLGQGLRAVGYSADGFIEAIEAPGRSFLVGVQWHAETLVDRPDQLALLQGFISEAVRFSTRLAEQAA